VCGSRGTQIQKATFYSSPAIDARNILEKISVTCKAKFYRPVQVLWVQRVKDLRISKKKWYMKMVGLSAMGTDSLYPQRIPW
jgi:hypothetical protein